MDTTTTRTNTHDFQVGDIVYGSWGYDQTNIDYYAIIRTTRTKVELLPIGAELVSSSHGQDVIVPDPTQGRSHDIQIETGSCSPYGKTRRETKLCNTRDSWNGECVVVLNDRHCAYRYSGPMSATSTGWGH